MIHRYRNFYYVRQTTIGRYTAYRIGFIVKGRYHQRTQGFGSIIPQITIGTRYLQRSLLAFANAYGRYNGIDGRRLQGIQFYHQRLRLTLLYIPYHRYAMISIGWSCKGSSLRRSVPSIPIGTMCQ